MAIATKTYRHLWDVFASDENYRLAVKNATKHKSGKRRKYRKARYILERADERKQHIMRMATNPQPIPHVQVEIYDGIRRKRRKIVVPSMEEQVLHHMVINVLKPILMRSMYEHSYGSLPERGAHLAKKRMERWVRHGGRRCKYVLKMDVRKFFDTVPRDRLKAMLRRVIADERLMAVIDAIIDSGPGEVGIPIGFYTSQWFANFYLTGLDHYIKERLGADYYMRYMDDMVVLGPNKRRLHRMREAIERYLNEELGLAMKGNWQVYRFHYVKGNGGETGRDIDYMGFRVWRDRVTLRRTIMLKCTRKARRVRRKVRDRGRKTVHDARQSLSYLGWIDATDTYDMYTHHVKPFVSFQQMRRQVSRHDRALARAQRMERETAERSKQSCGYG